MLLSKGYTEAVANRLEKPAGLIPATCDPGTLALSIISETIDRIETLQAKVTPAEFPRRTVTVAE